MIIKPEYTEYSLRLLIGLITTIVLSVVFTLFLFLADLGKVEIFVAFGVLMGIIGSLSISVIKKCKYFLTEIQIGGDTCELKINRFDKPSETIQLDLSITRIKIYENFFPSTKLGRTYKLIIETKQGLSYKSIFQQYEIGTWDLQGFKKVIELYSKTKGVIVPIDSYSRANFTNSKED